MTVLLVSTSCLSRKREVGCARTLEIQIISCFESELSGKQPRMCGWELFEVTVTRESSVSLHLTVVFVARKTVFYIK